MSNTNTITHVSRNDSPSIGVLHFEDPLLGKIVVSDESSQDLSCSGTHAVKIAIGNDLVAIRLTTSSEQYIKVKGFLDVAQIDLAPSKMLLRLAYLCADEAIQSRFALLGSKEDLKSILRCTNPYLADSVEGLLAWCPLKVWNASFGKGGSRYHDALILRLGEILKDAPQTITEAQTEEIKNAESRGQISCVKDPALRRLLSFVFLCRNDYGPENWPRSAFGPLMQLASLECFDTITGCVTETALKCLKQGRHEFDEEAKIKLVEAVCKLEGPAAVFKVNPLRDLACEAHRALGLGESDSLVSCLSQIPSEWILGLPDDEEILSTSLEHWNCLTEDLKAEVTEVVRTTPLVLTDLRLYPLPRELGKSISCDSVMDKFLCEPCGCSYVAHRLGSFRNLSEGVCRRLIDSGHSDDVASHLGAFKLSEKATISILLELIDKGCEKEIVQQLPSISDKVLGRVDQAGHCFVSFKRDCRVLLPDLYTHYKVTHRDDGPLAAQQLGKKVWNMLDSIVGYAPVAPEDEEGPIFQALCDYAYPCNGEDRSGSLTHCKDQSDDVFLFDLPQEPIPLRLSGAVSMVLRRNMVAEPSVVGRIENLVRGPLKFAADRDSAREKVKQQLQQIGCLEIQTELYSGIIEALEQVRDGKLHPSKVKRAFVAYHAVEHANFEHYAAESVNRAEQAPNRDYAYLLELRDFLTTAVVDSLTAAIDRNPAEDPSTRDRLVLTAQGIFSEEVEALDKELSKYVAQDERGETTRDITALFIKTAPSAGMRQVAGLCVAVDNPDPETERYNMWEMENYLQLVLRDEQTRRCVGGVLLHYYEQQGKRILTASLNPSSTLLYKVDEEALFKELVRVLGDFARVNEIDIIGVSTDSGIRTNRTGGLFERALNHRIREISERFNLDSKEQFSYEPPYRQQALDVIWRKND